MFGMVFQSDSSLKKNRHGAYPILIKAKHSTLQKQILEDYSSVCLYLQSDLNLAQSIVIVVYSKFHSCKKIHFCNFLIMCCTVEF